MSIEYFLLPSEIISPTIYTDLLKTIKSATNEIEQKQWISVNNATWLGTSSQRLRERIQSNYNAQVHFNQLHLVTGLFQSQIGRFLF